VAIAVEPGWKTIRAVLFAVIAHPRVGSQGQVVMKVSQGDARAARRGLAWSGSPYLPVARCRAEGTTRKRTRSALRVVPCRGEALEPAHEERGNGERATVGGADGGEKKQRRRSPGVDTGSLGSGSVQAARGGSSSGSGRRWRDMSSLALPFALTWGWCWCLSR
jgi:hypothetical protein